MDANILRLYPPPSESVPLKGLYLAHALRTRPSAGRPFVYTNFVMSLDGRISEADTIKGRKRVPEAIANARDWRLFMELVAQADALLTTGRHLRAIAQGKSLEFAELPADLAAWRYAKGLAPFPHCFALTKSLQVPAAALRDHYYGPLTIFTPTKYDDQTAREFSDQRIELVHYSTGNGMPLSAIFETLHRRGYTTLYSIAGPKILHALLAADCLDRLYLTLSGLVLGGEYFDTLTRGPRFTAPRGFTPHQICFDPVEPERAGQFFLCFDRSK